MGEEEKVDKIYNVLSSKSGESLHLYRSKPTYIEMAPKQISKLTGMGVLLDRLYPDIKLEDIIAYGDNYNDMEMLQHVGFGVAVANAKEEVKAIANEITDANIDDGVAKHLQKIFQLKF
jgi:hydroxymethylpyrimidine pyrophosphatase-like HAD family hydrolase